MTNNTETAPRGLDLQELDTVVGGGGTATLMRFNTSSTGPYYDEAPDRVANTGDLKIK